MNTYSLNPSEVLGQWDNVLSFVTNLVRDNMEHGRHQTD